MAARNVEVATDRSRVAEARLSEVEAKLERKETALQQSVAAAVEAAHSREAALRQEHAREVAAASAHWERQCAALEARCESLLRAEQQQRCGLTQELQNSSSAVRVGAKGRG